MHFNMTMLVPYLAIFAAILFVQRTFSNMCDMYQMQNFICFQKIKTCPHKILTLGAVIDDFLLHGSNLYKFPISIWALKGLISWALTHTTRRQLSGFLSNQAATQASVYMELYESRCDDNAAAQDRHSVKSYLKVQLINSSLRHAY